MVARLHRVLTTAWQRYVPRSRTGLALAAVAAVVLLLVVEDLAGGLLDRLLLYLPGIDKFFHAVQALVLFFAARAIALRMAFRPGTAAMLAALGVLAVALADEVQQTQLSNRSVEQADVLAAGGGLVIALGLLLARHRRRFGALLAIAGMALSGGVIYHSWNGTRHYKYGLRMAAEGRFDEARAAYARALAAGMNTPSLFNGLAWVEVESGHGDAEQAVRWAARSLELEPGNSDALDTYGWTLYHAGRYDEARARLQEAFALDPNIYCIQYHLAMVALAQGQRAEAIERLHLQVQRAPNSPEGIRAREMLERDATLKAPAHDN